MLTALTHFWASTINGFQHHLIADKQQPVFNAAYSLKQSGLDIPLERSLVVYDMTNIMDEFEFIFRHHIGGSVYKNYAISGQAAGQTITPGLPEWSKLSEPIFTPSTKEDIGHDINVDAEYYFHRHSGDEAREFVAMLKNFYTLAYEYAEKKGILILDTKFEGSSVLGIIGDEFLTPDSSRFCDAEDWKEAMKTGRKPKFLDKQFVREWAMKLETPFGQTGIHKLDPSNPEHLTFVHSLPVPAAIIQATTEKYLEIFYRLTGQHLPQYQKEMMGV